MNDRPSDDTGYRSFFDRVPVGLFRSTPDGRLLDANPALVEILGYPDLAALQELRLSTLYVNPEQRGHHMELLERDGHLDDVESLLLRPDGETIWVQERARAVRGPGGKVAYLEGSLVDVTERVRTAEALLRSEGRYRLLVEHQVEGLAITDLDEGIDFSNPAAERIFGVGPGELVGRNLAEFTTAETFGRIQGQTRRRIQGLSDAYRVEIVRPDGEVRTLSLHVAPWRDGGHGRVRGSFATFSDVTDQIRAEDEARLLQAQLIQAQKLEAIGTLAGGIAHDFNNLLTAIEGFASLASERVEEGSPLLEDLLQVEGAVARAASLTRQLLLFGRKQPLRPVEVGINHVVRDLLAMLDRLLGEDIAIEADLSPGLWTVVVDEPSLEQVVVNLAVNARDAMPDGGVLAISTRNLPAAEATPPSDIEAVDSVVLEVRDTGTGIDAAHLDQIFDPFFTTKEAGKGTGIGLSVVYGILRQHSGWIEVDSAAGRGTRFRVYLPAHSDLTELTPPRPSRRKRSGQPARGKGQRILVVEDESLVLRFTRRALVGSGYRVLTASTGAQAKAILEREAAGLDLLFSDVVLPDTTGVDLAEWIRQAHPELRVLLSSGYMDHKSQWPRIHQLGLPFLQKPYALSDLLTAVRQALEVSE